MHTSIAFAAVTAFIEQLGAEPDEVARVEITPGCVAVTEYRLNEAGRRFAAGGGPATVTTEIRIEGNRHGADAACIAP